MNIDHTASPGPTTRRPHAFLPPSPQTQPQAALGTEHFFVSFFSFERKFVLSFYFLFCCTIGLEHVRRMYFISEHCEITQTVCAIHNLCLCVFDPNIFFSFLTLSDLMFIFPSYVFDSSIFSSTVSTEFSLVCDDGQGQVSSFSAASSTK